MCIFKTRVIYLSPSDFFSYLFNYQEIIDKGSDTSYKLRRSVLLHINHSKDNILQKHNIISFVIIWENWHNTRYCTRHCRVLAIEALSVQYTSKDRSVNAPPWKYLSPIDIDGREVGRVKKAIYDDHAYFVLYQHVYLDFSVLLFTRTQRK